jgi:hypothetical protein
MRPTLIRTVLALSIMCSPSMRGADMVTVYGINPAGGEAGSWIESFNITIDAAKKTATAQEVDSFREARKLNRGGAILVVRGDIYYANHGALGVTVGKTVWKTTNKTMSEAVFNAQTASGYAGFAMGIGDISGDDTHIWLNPYDGTNKVFEFVPDPKAAAKWKVALQFNLGNAGDRYDGMEVQGGNIYANRADANFALTGANPCNGKPNAIYDQYNAANGNLVKARFIATTFPASGIAFNGTYFFVSDICNNKIAVYDNTGALIAEADLGAPPNDEKALCANVNLKRCIEDLSVVVSPPPDLAADNRESESESAPVETSWSHADVAPGGKNLTLSIVVPAQNPVQTGEIGSFTVSVKDANGAVISAPVSFATTLGDIRFVSGETASDGMQSTVPTNQLGQATIQFVTGQPGLSIVQMTCGGVTRSLQITASNMKPMDSQ